ncbi:MAG: hypothetical protein WD032_10340 [Nitrospirales bacterium]
MARTPLAAFFNIPFQKIRQFSRSPHDNPGARAQPPFQIKNTYESEGLTTAPRTGSRTEQGREYSPETRAFSRKPEEEVARTFEEFFPMANKGPRGDSQQQLEGMFKIVRPVLISAERKAAAILVRGTCVKYVNTAK